MSISMWWQPHNKRKIMEEVRNFQLDLWYEHSHFHAWNLFQLHPIINQGVTVYQTSINKCFQLEKNEMSIHSVNKGRQTLRVCSTHRYEKKIPVILHPKTNCLLKYGWYLCSLYIRCSIWFPCMSTHLSALCYTEVHTVSHIPGFTQISKKAFSTHCCDTSKSMISPEYIRCSGVCKARGLHRPVNCTSMSHPLSTKGLVQALSDKAEKMRWWPTMHEPNICCWWRGASVTIRNYRLKKNHSYSIHWISSYFSQELNYFECKNHIFHLKY